MREEQVWGEERIQSFTKAEEYNDRIWTGDYYDHAKGKWMGPWRFEKKIVEHTIHYVQDDGRKVYVEKCQGCGMWHKVAKRCPLCQ